MGSFDIGGLWCPECGTEYRPNFVECSDCRVRLSAERPPPRSGPASDAVDHERVVYELTEWSDDQRGALELMLTGAQVPHGWEGSSVLVPRQRERDADDLIDSIEDGKVVEDSLEVGDQAPDDDPSRDPTHPSVASAGQRLLGYVIDGIVLFAASVAIGQGVLHLDSSSPVGERLLIPALIAAYAIVGVARWGRTIGKLIVGTRVVAFADDGVPGWRRAVIRWAVQVGPAFPFFWIRGGVVLTFVPGLVTNLWLIVVYVGILWNPLLQGLHDKAAGTIVVTLHDPA